MLAAAMFSVLLTAACTISGQATPVPVSERPGSLGATSLATLNAASEKSCPLMTLPAAARAAGLAGDGDPRGTVEAIGPEIRGLTGVAVDCSIDVDGEGSISVLLVVGQNGSAVVGLAGRLNRESGLTVPETQAVVTDADAQPPGSLVRIPGTDPVALRIISVDGAASAAMLVVGKNGPTRSQVEVFAGALAHR